MANTTQEKYEKILQEIEQRGRDDNIIDVNEEMVQLVFFTLGKNLFSFHGPHVREILPVDQITEIPGSSDLFLGVVNVRGEIDSVLHLHQFLGFSSGKMLPSSRIVIAVHDGIRTGILVDSVENILDFPISAIDKNMASLTEPIRGLSDGQITYAGNITPILDMAKIFRRLEGGK